MYPLGAFFKTVVYKHIIVPAIILHFVRGFRQSSFNDIFGIQSTALKPPSQFLAVWWQHEDADCVGNLLFKLRRSLDVYVKQQIVALLFGLIEKAAGSSIVMAENIRVFKKFVRSGHPFKLLY